MRSLEGNIQTVNRTCGDAHMVMLIIIVTCHIKTSYMSQNIENDLISDV